MEGFIVIMQKADGTIEIRYVGLEAEAKRLARAVVQGGECVTAVMVPAFCVKA